VYLQPTTNHRFSRILQPEKRTLVRISAGMSLEPHTQNQVWLKIMLTAEIVDLGGLESFIFKANTSWDLSILWISKRIFLTNI
jgi:hypothetical protein